MRQLANLLSAHNILVPFHLWWRKILLKVKKPINVLSKFVASNTILDETFRIHVRLAGFAIVICEKLALWYKRPVIYNAGFKKIYKSLISSLPKFADVPVKKSGKEFLVCFSFKKVQWFIGMKTLWSIWWYSIIQVR